MTSSQRPPALLSRVERERLIQRGLHGLYRWYTDRSQTKRNWNPDRSFDWRSLSSGHSEELVTIVEGFYGVEQYAPDYTAELTRLSRRDYGRAHFLLRWGAEEERHADLWRNVLLFSQRRSHRQIELYTEELRARQWEPPFQCPLRMLLYTVFQERATQLNYLNLAKVARGESDKPQFASDKDAVLEQGCRVIAADEAAHYDFFLEGARLHLYYRPEDTLQALTEVLRKFTMPAASIVPDYERFIRTLYEGSIFGPRIYALEVVPAALAQLGIENLRSIERATKHQALRTPEGIPTNVANEAAAGQPVDPLDHVRYSVVESGVIRLFERVQRFEAETGLCGVDPCCFVANAWQTGGTLALPDEQPQTLMPEVTA